MIIPDSEFSGSELSEFINTHSFPFISLDARTRERLPQLLAMDELIRVSGYRYRLNINWKCFIWYARLNFRSIEDYLMIKMAYL